MKFLLTLLLLASVGHAATFSTVKVGDGAPILPSSIFEAKSTTQGLLVPRMTTTQKTAISSPATGLMVYDLTLNSFSVWNGSAWASIGGGGGSGSVTLVGLSAPAFLTVNNQPITSSGTIALGYSGIPIPISSGGTNNSNSNLNTNRVIVSTATSLAESSTTSTQLSYLDATSSIQTQLNSKTTLSLPVSVTNGGTNTSNPLFNGRVIVSSGGTIGESGVTSTTLNFLDATSSVQTQLNGKQSTLTLPLSVTNGGTATANPLFNNRIIISSGGTIGEAGAITSGRALSSNALGIPVASTTTNTELGYVSGVTSAIQTQINNKLSLGGNLSDIPQPAVAFYHIAQVATGSTLGVISLSAQTMGSGVKTFSSNPTFSAMGTSGVLLNSGAGAITSSAGPLAISNGGTNIGNALSNNRVIVSSNGTIGEMVAGTVGYLLTAGGPGQPNVWASLPAIISNSFVSTQVTTTSSSNASASFATFSNSPSFSVTPTTSGNYRVYASATMFVDTTSTKGIIRVINTSGGATLLKESQAGLDNGGALIIGNGFVQSTYTLTAGNTYVFDLQGKVITGAGGVYLDGTDAPFYMWAEPQLATPGSNVSSVSVAAPSFLSVSGSPITTSGTITLGLSGTALPVSSGGTSTNNPLFNNRVIVSSGGTIGESGVAATTLAFLDVNSSVQKALNGYNMRAHGSTSTVANAFMLIAFSTTDWDTATGYNSSTGVYTIPVAGKYHITGSVNMTATTAVAAQAYQLEILQNNVQKTFVNHLTISAVDKTNNIFINDDVNCNVGDSIAIAGLNTNTGPSISNSNPASNWISIFKVGN